MRQGLFRQKLWKSDLRKISEGDGSVYANDFLYYVSAPNQNDVRNTEPLDLEIVGKIDKRGYSQRYLERLFSANLYLRPLMSFHAPPFYLIGTQKRHCSRGCNHVEGSSDRFFIG